MKPTLQDLIELAREQAELVLIGLGQDLMPSWLFINDQGKVSIVGTPWQDELEKHITRVALQKKMREDHVVAYSFVSEVWMSTKPAGWKPPPNYQGASHEPDRREAVIAFATDGSAQEFRTWLIERDSSERVCALNQVRAKQDEEPALQGWMTELLK
jgi:hypothetical protein